MPEGPPPIPHPLRCLPSTVVTNAQPQAWGQPTAVSTPPPEAANVWAGVKPADLTGACFSPARLATFPVPLGSWPRPGPVLLPTARPRVRVLAEATSTGPTGRTLTVQGGRGAGVGERAGPPASEVLGWPAAGSEPHSLERAPGSECPWCPSAQGETRHPWDLSSQGQFLALFQLQQRSQPPS